MQEQILVVDTTNYTTNSTTTTSEYFPHVLVPCPHCLLQQSDGGSFWSVKQQCLKNCIILTLLLAQCPGSRFTIPSTVRNARRHVMLGVKAFFPSSGGEHQRFVCNIALRFDGIMLRTSPVLGRRAFLSCTSA